MNVICLRCHSTEKTISYNKCGSLQKRLLKKFQKSLPRGPYIFCIRYNDISLRDKVPYKLRKMKTMEVNLMKKNLTELVFILDRSGSMSGLEADTIGGFNSLIAKQKKEEGEALISTVLFDDRQEVLYDRVPLNKIAQMTEEQYYVRGCTALLDAIGGAIHHIGNVHKYAREEDIPEKTLFIITTDGMENSSRQYTYDKVREMVTNQKEKYNWEFLFLGANIDAIATAARFGIARERAVNFENDSEGTQLNYEVLNVAVSNYRACKAAKPQMADNWAEEIQADYKRRHKKK